MAGDLSGARRAGYTDTEIVDYLGQQRGLDVGAARTAGYSDRELLARLMRPPERSTGEQVARGVGLFGAGANEGIARAVGALPDLASSGLRAIGLPTPEPGFYTDAARRGLRTITGEPPAPENTVENLAYGAGKGAVDAAAFMVPAAAVARTAQAGGVLQGAAQAAMAQPALQVASGAVGGAVGEATDSPLLGAAASLLPAAGVAAAGRLVRPVQSSLTPEAASLAQSAAREGIPLTPAQQTGSRPLQTMEAVFERLPLTSRTQGEIIGGQQVAFNRAALRRAGIDADRASPEVIDAAFNRLGAEFERLSASTTVSLDPEFMRDMGRVVTRYGEKLSSTQRPAFASYVRDIMAANGQLPGATYQMARSDMTRQARAVSGNDPFFANALRGLRDALDDAAGRSIPAADQEAWNTARRQYANLQVITKAATGAGQGGAVGDISAANLRGALVTGDRRGYARGNGDLNELARIGQQFIRPQVPNSGTPERLAMTSLLTGGGLGGAGGMAMGANPLAGAAIGLGSVAAPRAAQAVYNIPAVQRYLANAAGRPAPGVNRNALMSILANQGARNVAP